MPINITIDDASVNELMDRLLDFETSTIREPLEDSANRLVGNLKSNIVAGQDIHDSGYPKIAKSTYEQEISRSGPFTDTRIRKNVSSDATAMNVTGQSLDSLMMEEVSSTEFVVGYDGARADIVFKSNAKNPGATHKPVRDPLGLNEAYPTDFEVDVVEKNINDAIDRLLNVLQA